MKRLFSIFSLAAMLLLGFALPHGAQANTIMQNGVTCVSPIGDPALSGQYPDDGTATTAGHAYWCGKAYGDTKNAYTMVETVGIGMKTTIVPALKTAGVTYYLFSTRDEENTFWGSGSINYNNTAYCGHTGYGGNFMGTSIASNVWTNCANTWNKNTKTPTDPNIWMSEVTKHETGHAYDYSFAAAIAKKNMLNPKDNPSRSAGFKQLVAADLASLDKSGHPSTCLEFGDARTPSGIESGWPVSGGKPAPLPAVCDGGGQLNTKYSGLTNLAIAKLVSLYFVAPSSTYQYQDIFVQEIVFASGGPGDPQVVPAIVG